ncbi:pirin family protein [Abyssalbus ytuae]|uniref:Pirin family protein n=1 Tax=Abyssalbus ytuae TaxID=2926907 RepID=A0A9E6ZT28_9FLAO|nr:pirin family protein [Abyssalbus ytuae]UOB18333.1 pirin family protein [Abyssalbus ytuae]
MKTILHKSNTRGHANHGWLNTYHSFSFANYYNPERMNFGALRVLNDDTVAPGMGFGKHPHDNMEIISIPLYGDLEHEDSMGNKVVIKEGDIQIMTAGTGIIHSEKNKNLNKEVKFLQIWILPKHKNVKPNYDQITLKPEDRKNKLQQIVSPKQDESGVTINQDAWFYITEIDTGRQLTYHLKGKNTGVYAFVIDGNLDINNIPLATRDGLGITETDKIDIQAVTNAQLLLMEVPLNI